MADSVTLSLVTRKRWWFGIAFHALKVLVSLGMVRDIDGASKWLVLNGMWFGTRIGEGRVQSLRLS